jgi:hypothetical protein
MKIVGVEKLHAIFRTDIPEYAVRLMLQAPEDADESHVALGLQAAKFFTDDKRIRNALQVARPYIVPEGTAPEKEGKLLTNAVLMLAAVFADLDR